MSNKTILYHVYNSYQRTQYYHKGSWWLSQECCEVRKGFVIFGQRLLSGQSLYKGLVSVGEKSLTIRCVVCLLCPVRLYCSPTVAVWLIGMGKVRAKIVMGAAGNLACLLNALYLHLLQSLSRPCV